MAEIRTHVFAQKTLTPTVTQARLISITIDTDPLRLTAIYRYGNLVAGAFEPLAVGTTQHVRLTEGDMTGAALTAVRTLLDVIHTRAQGAV